MAAYSGKLRFSSFPDLSSTAKLVAEYLEETRADLTESWVATKAIAKQIGRSIRTAQLALEELARLGFIRVKRARLTPDGRPLNSGHRIFLFWRTGTPLEPLLFSAANCATEAQSIAPDPAFPPDPPIGVSEDDLKERIDGGTRAEPASKALVSPEPPPLPPPSEKPKEPRKATPHEIETTVAKAAKVLGPDPTVRQRVLGLARRWGLSWVAAAFDRAAEKQAHERLERPIGYVVRVLEGFAIEGGPPPAPPSLEQRSANFAERLAAYEREQEAAFEAFAFRD